VTTRILFSLIFYPIIWYEICIYRVWLYPRECYKGERQENILSQWQGTILVYLDERLKKKYLN
jgi:hypothetical protein